MFRLSRSSLPNNVNEEEVPVPPAPRSALSALANFLRARDYSAHPIDCVLAHVDENGTLEGCENLDAEDMAAAEETYVNALPGEPQMSHEWDDPERWELGPAPVEDESFEPEPGDRYWWAEQSLRPVTSGPTDEDWDEYARWSEWGDRVEQAHRITDEDIMVATGSCG